MRLGGEAIRLLSYHDDDFYGLWEVDWHFNGDCPAWSHAERVAFLTDLVREGFVEVRFGPLMTERPPLSQEEAMTALNEPASWSPPPKDGDRAGYYVTTSRAGIEAVRSAGL